MINIQNRNLTRDASANLVKAFQHGEHLPNAVKNFLILDIKSKDNDNREAGYLSPLTIIEALVTVKLSKRYIN